MLFPRDHQAGEIESILMRWCIGTVVETKFTVIALIDDPMVVSRCELRDVSFVPINAVKQRVERRTQIEAASAAIADFIDALRVFLELRGVDGIDQAQTIHSAHCLL
jgi:hypothetical protein